ncbi:DUF2156 domain-containing protein [Microbacterium sp. zg.Y1090]|uniref:bifunctional lysylphosphatidylglycerol flippase/synthetase MprF n=1 Tax=Microbacterium TaxID=33882 RepID=UPI00214BDC02|nr:MULTISPECIES: DUF2156 domain-containing protein [unclassified Microbacterium]MCR2813051.1 DUF2156 domain-containing protein [Microbacterium sp. zg.Y1084]MCR2819365.1 DUF2156 domain-containing protein [Microbacterium sp. zg.Y1090]MDL5487282.1 DUF2156 domain-containing protein [Microbacterium sp. zg-Y1211]WIM28345.1 DUF2156 domain-containing protein [Microbacterium sp. zg-Y1090]
MTEGTASRRLLPRVARRLPVALSLVVLLLVCAVGSQALWRPLSRSPLWDQVAYGVPAFADGRWWTPLTGTFFSDPPWLYVIVVSGFAGVAFLEFRRGSRIALSWFTAGQLVGVLAMIGFIAAASLAWPWPWAAAQAASLDVGPSGGTMACIAASASAMRSPWRERVWFVVIGACAVLLLFWATLADVVHAFAVLLVLVVQRPLAAWRTTLRERRFLGFTTALAIATAEVLSFIAPTSGPFGGSDAASSPLVNVVVDVVLLMVVAHGLRRGRRWAWIVSIVLAAVNIAWSIVVGVGVRVPGVPDDAFGGDPAPLVAEAGVWAIFLAYLVWSRAAFRAGRHATIGTDPEPTAEDAALLLRAHGGGTLSWMTTWKDMSYLRTTTGIVAYQRHAGVAIALADPLGPADGRAGSVWEFAAASERAGIVPCWFGASDATRQAAPAGWRSLVVADDTIVDLPGLQFGGNAWKPVRTSLNRARREGMTFRLTRLIDESWGVQAQLRVISQSWVGGKDLPEMGFTLGTLDEARDPEVRLALAISPDGDVDGFLSWLPVYGAGGTVTGWTLDLMRRREGGFVPVMEYLIGSSALQFSAEGAQLMSLSGAPLTHHYPPGAGVIAALSERLAQSLEPVYGFRSLHRFKEKFHPRYDTLHLLYRDESDLPRIGAGLVRAFLPDASLRQFADAGLVLVRGEGD